ncbi:nucleoside hydrolase [Glaesserella parasuis]|nr:nucleoside hydrolase [Glaesserella parasuis]MCT8766936.1 nucleoside hydrolase [Glaesserella parasuis]
MRKKIILDCDPGHDDAIAILLAYGNPDIDLLAVTTVVGNQTLEKVSRNALAKFVVELLDFFGKMYKQAQGFDYPPVHDPCAVAYVIDPTLIETQKVPVNIELTGTHTLGMTVADFRYSPKECNTYVAKVLDRERFWDLVIDAIKRLQ